MKNPTPPIPSFEIDKMRVINKGNLKAFFSVLIAKKMWIHGCRLVQQPGQQPWASLPQNEYTDKEGKKKYSAVVELPAEWKEAFNAAAVDYYLQSASGQEYQDSEAGW